MALQLIGTDITGSTLLALSDGLPQDLSYSAFGSLERGEGVSISIPGFNGERNDPINGVTHLGNGYRAFNPALMRFNCPDRESPFGVGGINAYAYCANDPVNRIDPSGKQIITAMFAWIFKQAFTLIGMETAEATAASAAAKVVKKTAAASFTLALAAKGTEIAANTKERHDGDPAKVEKLLKGAKFMGDIAFAGQFTMLDFTGGTESKLMNHEGRLRELERLAKAQHQEIETQLLDEVEPSLGRSSGFEGSQSASNSSRPAALSNRESIATEHGQRNDDIHDDHHANNRSSLTHSLEAKQQSTSRMNNESGSSFGGTSNSSPQRPRTSQATSDQDILYDSNIPAAALNLRTLFDYYYDYLAHGDPMQRETGL